MQKIPPQFDQTQLWNLTVNYMKYQAFVKRHSPHTLRAYSLDLSQAFGFEKLGKWDLSGLEKGQITPPPAPKTPAKTGRELPIWFKEAHKKWLPLGPKSRNRKVATLKSFSHWLYEQGHTPKDYSHDLVGPKTPHRLPFYLSLDEVLAVIQYLKADSAMAKDKFSPIPGVLFLLLYGGGLRISEACGLQWKMINFSNRSLSVTGKGNKNRLVILPQSLIPMLQALKNQTGGETYIWGEKSLSSRTAYQFIRNLGAAAGLTRPIHPHLLRHSFATHLLSSGTNLRVLQKMLGHESLSATEKYTHLNLQQLAETLDRHHPLAKAKGG